MGWLKALGRNRAVAEGAGALAAAYLALVRRTNRFTVDAGDARDHWPLIIAMWHGQHLMVPFAASPGDRIASLVSRSRDGDLNAALLRWVSIRPIRGSGARGRDPRAKGGAPALREMLRSLGAGETVALTADIPKIARSCGSGIVLLARLSGRPIVPLAVATSRRHVFGSWDRATIGLPFGRGAIVAGRPIAVPADADEAAQERCRLEVERSLDAVHARAFALVGRDDPGAGLRGARR